MTPETKELVIPPTECLIQFGHSIVRDKKGRWHLTRLLQTVKELGVAPDGFRKFIRTGRIEQVGPDQRSAIVGGGVITTTATVEVYKRLKERGQEPKVVVHSGGRSAYMERVAPADTEISEGKVMQRVFLQRLKYQPKKEVLIENCRITEDDIRNSLRTALESGCKSATFVGLEIRLPRCRAFYEEIMQETDQYFGITVNFLAAEDVIGDIARSKGRTAQWEKILMKYRESEGYKRTLEAETAGIQALKAGIYGHSLGGTGKT